VAKTGGENTKSRRIAEIRRIFRIASRHKRVTRRNHSTARFRGRALALAMCPSERYVSAEKPLAGGLAAAAAKPPTGGFASSYPTAPAVKPAGNFHGRPLAETPPRPPNASPFLADDAASAAPGGISSTPLVKKNLPSEGTSMMRTLSDNFSATIF